MTGTEPVVKRVAVVGAGSWGTTVAALVAARTPTTLWARREELAARIASAHENHDYLPDVPLPEALHATSSLAAACEGADVVVMAVPSHGTRAVLTEARAYIAPDAPVISLSKGIEQGTLRRMTEVIAEVLDGHDPGCIGVLTGPNLAKEVAAGQPTASVVAVTDGACAKRLQQLFVGPMFRVYTNPDVIGCEMAGALKNVIAIGAGIADGLAYGDNTKAALMTRGLAELARLGVALGGDPLTFAGLAGMGDLIANVQQPAEPQPSRGRRAREGSHARRDRDGDEHGRRRRQDHVRRARTRRAGEGGDAGRVLRRAGAVRGCASRRPRARAHAAQGEVRAARHPLMAGAGAGTGVDHAVVALGTLDHGSVAGVDALGVVRTMLTGAASVVLDWWIGADDRWRVAADDGVMQSRRARPP